TCLKYCGNEPLALMSLLTALTVLRPLRALVQQARRAGAGETGAVQPLVRPVTREIAELSQAVSSMAQHLEQRADYIRAFAAHVSHEFKTPLAAMRGALELLRDHAETMTVAERERFLGNLDQDAARLERLVRRLLELARADVLQASVSDRAELTAVVRRMAERYAALGFTVAVLEPLPWLEVAISEDALESILSNLLDNARQHGADVLTLRCSSRAALACIEISDNGPGISAANAARVFEPFFTTARARGGTGLGLAVVRALLKAYRGRIELLDGGPGARLRIELPLASSSR
ncbi:MAG TPA: HAMP domain-containing sensor histidine kinase, partial [Candidatus Competibacteraceae bacterium]|nr:HAMP domain-containing sensor histidine kinase [Candidatus Competibacteraceae bacterium]